MWSCINGVKDIASLPTAVPKINVSNPIDHLIGTGWGINGWGLGLQGMRAGGERQLWVPAHRAYDERQPSAHIRPNSDLNFEIELLEVLTRVEE